MPRSLQPPRAQWGFTEFCKSFGQALEGSCHGRRRQPAASRLRSLLAGLPLPRFPDGRLVLAVDVSPWLRS
ncbi:hypothetical protein ACFYOV_24995, partial [Streptomyces sp. NPDC005931]